MPDSQTEKKRDLNIYYVEAPPASRLSLISRLTDGRKGGGKYIFFQVTIATTVVGVNSYHHLQLKNRVFIIVSSIRIPISSVQDDGEVVGHHVVVGEDHVDVDLEREAEGVRVEAGTREVPGEHQVQRDFEVVEDVSLCDLNVLNLAGLPVLSSDLLHPN